MSEESMPESAQDTQEPEYGDTEASAEDPAQAAIIKRYGFTPQQVEESKLFL